MCDADEVIRLRVQQRFVAHKANGTDNKFSWKFSNTFRILFLIEIKPITYYNHTFRNQGVAKNGKKHKYATSKIIILASYGLFALLLISPRISRNMRYFRGERIELQHERLP